MPISRRLLQRAIRQNLELEELLNLMDRAVELIPSETLPQLIEGVFDPDRLEENRPEEVALLAEIQAFQADSLAGQYYESFRVNSRNFMEKSRGTLNWIAEFGRLMNRCLKVSEAGDFVEAQPSFELLFGLLDEVDSGEDTIIFFADEAGSWQVGVDWESVLPSYFKALAAVAKPKAFAEYVLRVVNNHASYRRDQHLEDALKEAKPSQRKALQSLSKPRQ